MSELSEKDKALKAVLTMWNAIYNPPEFHILPNDIYKARKYLEEFIESAIEPPKDLVWKPRDNPKDETSLGGFHLGDQVKLLNSGEQWFVVGLNFNDDTIYINMRDYVHPVMQDRVPPQLLTFVSHGWAE